MRIEEEAHATEQESETDPGAGERGRRPQARSGANIREPKGRPSPGLNEFKEPGQDEQQRRVVEKLRERGQSSWRPGAAGRRSFTDYLRGDISRLG